MRTGSIDLSATATRQTGQRTIPPHPAIAARCTVRFRDPMIRPESHSREKDIMRLLARALAPKTTAFAHCDLPCGVYDPAQARIEAESVKAICEKYQGNADPEFRARALQIKEERSELVKHHLWVLWTD